MREANFEGRYQSDGFFLGKNLVCIPKVQSVYLLLAIYGYHLMSIINL